MSNSTDSTSKRRRTSGTTTNVATTSSTSLATAFSRLTTQLGSLATSLASSPSEWSLQDLSTSLQSLWRHLDGFEESRRVAGGNDNDQLVQLTDWQDRLDKEGVQLWNKSIALKACVEEESVSEQHLRLLWTVVGRLRAAAYRMVSLGSIEPLQEKDHASLLNLASKASIALLSAGQLVESEAVLTLAADHSSIPSPSSPSAATTSVAQKTLKAMLEFYRCRITLSIKLKKYDVAEWVRGTTRELVGRAESREIEALAQTGYDVGSSLIEPQEDPEGEASKDDADVRRGVKWLLWALLLLETRHENSVKALKVAVLQSLVQGYLRYLPSRSGWPEAEETLKQLLSLDNSHKWTRQQVKLVLARDASDEEITSAFAGAARSVATATEDSAAKLFTVAQSLKDKRRQLYFRVMSTVMLEVSHLFSAGKNEATKQELLAVIGQAFVSMSLIVQEGDFSALEKVYDQIHGAAPSVQLTETPAFVCTLRLWRLGDRENAAKRHDKAANWFLLATHPLNKVLEHAAWAKSFRKAALCYSELQRFDEAEKLAQAALELSNLARDHFVRFYNSTLQGDEQKATESLNAMVSAPGFTINLLLWAAKSAHQSNSTSLTAKVLVALLQACGKDGHAATNGIDSLILARSLIRLLTAQEEDISAVTPELLVKHFETACEIAESLSKWSPPPEGLLKGTAWIRRTCYNICTRSISSWSEEIHVALYNIVARLTDLEITLTPSPDAQLVSKLWLARFATLSPKVFAAREASSVAQKIEAYRGILSVVSGFRENLEEDLSTFPTLDRGESVQSSLTGIELEALAVLGEWERIAILFESHESSKHLSAATIKMAADQATRSRDDGPECPSKLMRRILKSTLEGLYMRSDLSSNQIASWLRLMVMSLIERHPSDALNYVRNVSSFVQQLPDYPKDEADWIVGQAWEQGLNLFSANDLRQARDWCTVAIELCRIVDPDLERRIEPRFQELCSRYPVQDEGEEDGEHSMMLEETEVKE